MRNLLFCSILGFGLLGGASAASAQGLGTGLTALYFNNGSLAGAPVLKRLDPAVDFRWANSAPAPELPADNFSVRWEGLLAAPSTGNYKFSVTSTEGVRLWVNGKKVIDTWNGKGSVRLDGNAVSLAAGEKTTIKLEYFDEEGEAGLQLQWMAPGQALQTIPMGNLYPQGSPTTPDPAEAVAAALAAAKAAQAPKVAAPKAPAAEAPAAKAVAAKPAPTKTPAKTPTAKAAPVKTAPAPKVVAAKPAKPAPAAKPAVAVVPVASLAGNVFMLKSRATNTPLEVVDESRPFRGTQAAAMPGRSTPPQWKIESAGEGFYRLLVQGSSKVLEVLGSSTSNGAPMSLWSYYSGNNQLWQIEDAGDGYYKLIAKHSHKALTAKDSADGGIQQWRYKGEPTQQWKLEPATIEVPATTLAANNMPGIGANKMSVYPNPSNGVVQMHYQLAETMPLGWVLYDQRGIVVRVSDYRKQAPGQHNQTLDFTSLPAGDYNLHLTVGTVTTTQPLVIRRPKAEPASPTAAQ